MIKVKNSLCHWKSNKYDATLLALSGEFSLSSLAQLIVTLYLSISSTIDSKADLDSRLAETSCAEQPALGEELTTPSPEGQAKPVHD